MNEKIQALKETLYAVIMEESLRSKEVIEISQQLDLLILEYYK